MSKLNSTKAFKNALPYVLTLILVGIMTFVAEILDEGEIIFPEITALAIGYMVTQKQGWKVNDSRMIALIAICAVAGVLTVRYIKVGLYLEILIAFVFAQILFMLSGTTFAPMISAIVLPVMMQTESFIYPIAAFLLTVAVVLFRRFLLKVKIRDKEDFQPENLHTKSDVIDTAVRIICVAVVGFFAIWSGFKFAIAPPLLVAFTEFSRAKNKARNKPVKTVLLITACAFVGAVSYVLNMTLGLPLTVAALTATAIMLVVVYCTKMYIPPAGALTILSMIIPSESVLLYPLQILVGTAVIMLISRLLFMKRQN
ncbi:hypothetical protein [Ruminococcus bromii]|uniref:hypothetical protein n=1 Tax=Ruminococcus bromii TaxID=40518 RepID=UPI00241D1165|nr:hypothetical protein [Ruminococcus bromii]